LHWVFVAHVDDGSTDLNLLRASADGGEEREWRAELACEVVHAEVRAVEAQRFGGYRQLDRLQTRIRRCAYVRVRLWCPVPEGEKADCFHACKGSSEFTQCSERVVRQAKTGGFLSKMCQRRCARDRENFWCTSKQPGYGDPRRCGTEPLCHVGQGRGLELGESAAER